MNHTRCSLAVLAAAAMLATPAAAQRRLRFGPLVSTISIENGNAVSSSYSGYGATLALLTGDYDETGLVVQRYNDLSDNSCTRQLTFFGLNSSYYPIGARGIAPFASTELGLARVSESPVPLLSACSTATPVQTTSQLGLGFGLGVRMGIGTTPSAPSRAASSRFPTASCRDSRVRPTSRWRSARCAKRSCSRGHWVP